MGVTVAFSPFLLERISATAPDPREVSEYFLESMLGRAWQVYLS
jgi:hypothetical protein